MTWLPTDAHASAEDALLALECHDPGGGKLLEGVYDCVRMKFDGVLGEAMMHVYTKLNNAIIAVLTMAIIFIAAKFILYGNRNPKAEVFGAIIKFSIVASMLFGISSGNGILEFRNLILGAGQAFAGLVFTGDPVFGGVGAGNVFQAMDQMILKILNLDSFEGVKKDGEFGAIAMMGGLLFSGPIGASVVSKGFGIIGMLLYAFVIALYINIISLVALTFLFCLSPLILPLVLFQYTQYIFQNWVKQIASYSLQPMILAAFLGMMLSVLAEMVGPFEEIATLAETRAKDPNWISSKIQLSSQEVQRPEDKEFMDLNRGSGLVGLLPMTDTTVSGPSYAGVNAQQHKEQVIMGITGANVKVPIAPLDPEHVRKLFASMISLFILIGAMMKFLMELPAWAAELAGGDKVTPSLAESQPAANVRKNLTGQ